MDNFLGSPLLENLTEKELVWFIDGCPAGLSIRVELIQKDLDRRRPGQSEVTTTRNESDHVEILSGVKEGLSLGSPICLFIKNKDQNQSEYSHIEKAFRPSHADYTYSQKYGLRDVQGGGRSSARETAARVAAGAIAKMLLSKSGIEITAYVSQVGSVKVTKDYSALDFNQIEKNIVRCADTEVADEMEKLIIKTKENGDTIGGKVTCVVQQSIVGLGEPVFDRLEG